MHERTLRRPDCRHPAGARYGWDGAPVHDAVAIAHVVDDTLLSTRRCGVIVDIGPELSRGRIHVDLLRTARTREVTWARGIGPERFLELL